MDDIERIARLLSEDTLGGFYDPVDVRYGIEGGGVSEPDVSELVGSDHLALATRFVQLVGGVDRALELVGKVGEVADVLDEEEFDAAVIDGIGDLL